VDHGWSLEEPPHPPSNSLVNLVLDHGLVYVGSEGSGAGRFDGRSWRLWPSGSSCAAPDDTCMSNPTWVYAMTMDQKGRKWFASWASGVEDFDDLAEPPSFHHLWSGAAWPNPHSKAWAAAVDQDGGHWFGMETDCDIDQSPECAPRGLDYYDTSGTWRAFLGPAGKVHSITVDDAGYVWAGYANPGRLLRFRPPVDPTAPAIFPGADSLRVNVEGLAARGQYVWALTDYSISLGGLFRFDLSGRIDTTRYETMDVVPPLAMHPLDVGPDGSVWVGSRSGLRRFPAPPTRHNFIDYTAENSPLVDDQVRAVRVDQQTGVVWLATAGGLSRFDPNYVPGAAAPPSLDLRIYPNPAMITEGATKLRLARKSANDPGGITSGTIYDVAGRHVCDFQVDLGRPDPQVFWDGHDDAGRLVRAGIYFVRIRAGSRATTMRVALVR
ncbi:MAG TPA: hypothetical protein VMS88_00765, partial [Terriglobales bacterium]|nr:hypothetical protein [Terriglobales bacterium]